MSRDKLITIRIEGDKRQAFGDLAKSQNTDTASLLYDFISGCLSGTLDIKLVTGKGNRLDNRIDSDRLDKLETTTQRLDERVGSIAKKLTDWIEAFDDRLNDCDQGLSNKITSLEHRLSTLASQLDSQQIGSIDTDSQKDSQQDRQGENPDIEPVATVETAIDTVETVKENVEAVTDKVEAVYDNVESVYDNVEAVIEIVEYADESGTSPLPNQETVETVNTVEPDSIDEPVQPAIGPVPGDSDSIESVTGEGMDAVDAAKYLKDKKVKVSDDSLYRWIRQEKIPDSPQGKKVQKYLTLINKVYYPKID